MPKFEQRAPHHFRGIAAEEAEYTQCPVYLKGQDGRLKLILQMFILLPEISSYQDLVQ